LSFFLKDKFPKRPNNGTKRLLLPAPIRPVHADRSNRDCCFEVVSHGAGDLITGVKGLPEIKT